MPRSISTAEGLYAYAKSIGWFDIEPSEYTGQGNPKTRKAPSSHAKEFAVGTIRTGMDGNSWKVTQTKTGVTRWTKEK